MPEEQTTTTTTTEDTATSRVEEILNVILGRLANLPEPQSRIETLLTELKEAIEAGGEADAQLAVRVDANSRSITALEATEVLQNTAIAGKINTSDIVICTREQYDALVEKTAIEYHIIEE